MHPWPVEFEQGQLISWDRKAGVIAMASLPNRQFELAAVLSDTEGGSLPPSLTSWRTWSAHIRIARIDHWVKNVFVLPGIVVALTLHRLPINWDLAGKALIGLLAVGLIASSNYVINEICDAPFDRFHPRS